MSQIVAIDHIGIAVQSIEQACKFYQQGLDLPLTHIEEVAEQKVRVAFLHVGESEIELLEPLGNEGPVASFLEKRGEGIHHICLRVADISVAMARLAAQGYVLLDKEPRLGAGGSKVAFVHPRSAHGVLIELSQKP